MSELSETTTTPSTTSEPRAGSRRARRRGGRDGEGSWQEPAPVWEVLVKYLLIGTLCLLVIVPIWMIVATSLAPQAEISRAGGFVLFPHHASLQAYRQILEKGAVARALMVSLGVTAVGTTLSTLLTSFAAYGLSRPTTLWHRPLLFTILLTYLFAPGLIPSYLVVKNLHLIDTYAALIVPGLVWAFNLILLRVFFMGLPTELIDSARMDGAGDLRILFQIVMPLSKAPLAVVSLFYAVGYWNNFFSAMLYLNDPHRWPLQMVLRQMVLQNVPFEMFQAADKVHQYAPELAIQMAVVVIAMIPVIIVYPFVQRHFVKGVIVGAVKG